MNEPSGPSDPSFEERLKRAREKSGLDHPPSKTSGPDWSGRPLALAFLVATELAAAMLVAIAIGWALDRWLGTRPWLMVVFAFLGIAAGILNVWRLVMPRGQDET